MPSRHATPNAFVEYWSRAEASERANAQAFLIELAELLGVPAPSHSHAGGYSFEYPVAAAGIAISLRYSRRNESPRAGTDASLAWLS
jgi:hypothetical protein